MDVKTTIYDIAKESGVSVTTVSRVLNNNPLVSDNTRRKVLDVVDKHQYTPNSIARAMTSKQTKTIGVILPDISNPYFSALFLEIERFTLEQQYSVILYNTLYGGSSHGVQSPFGEIRYLEMMRENCVDGVIVTGGQLDLSETPAEYVAALNNLARIMPVVVIGQHIAGCECLFLHRNLSGGVPALVMHLATLGHHRIGFIGGERGIRQTISRQRAYRQTMESLGLAIHPEDVVMSNFYTQDGYEAMSKLFENDSLPQAVIAINDNVAIGAIRAINDQGMRVPENIAIASCDMFAGSEFCTPRLTTLDQQNGYLGQLAIRMLMSAISDVGEGIRVKHTPQLVIRESCGAKLKDNH
ncbi:MAG: LacI family transcriptional regulator [Oscillospiraceae bacterium]|jgi:LacI family transcriptional regulator|nr:LacI family transcriptional regulator [Oscillospiraceae bacterium]